MKEGWTYKKLGEVCYKITDGSHNPPKGIEHSDNVMLSSQNVQNGFLDMSAVRYLSDADFEIENKRTNASKGDVLLTIVGTIGRTCVLKGNEGNITFQRSVAILKPKEEIMSRYLMFFLMSCNSKLNSTAQGAAQKGIYLKQLGDITLHYPSIEVQQRIVERLDAAFENIDKLKANAEKQLAEAQTLFQKSLAKAMEPKEGWEEKTLGQLGDLKNGMNFAHNEKGVDLHILGVGDFGNRFSIDDVRELQMISLNQQPSEDYLLKDGDIVFVRSNGNKQLVGRSLVVYTGDNPTTFSGFCIRFRKSLKVLDERFLVYFLKSENTRKKLFGNGANISNLNQKILQSLIVPLPPLAVQQRIVERLDALSENIRKYEEIQRQIISECDALKQALLRKVFE